MKKLKRIFTALVCLLLIFSLVSCGEIVNPNPDLPKPDDTPDDPIKPDTPAPEGGYTFTVSFEYNGVKYIPDESVTVQWYDGKQYHRAEVDERGVATMTGLDGEYHVTLIEPLTEYTFDPSKCNVDNDNRDLVIKLYKLSEPVSGRGQGLYQNAYTINKTGYYRVKVTKKDQRVSYRFAATASGEYYFSSLVDTTDDNVSPILYHYGNASVAYVNEKDVTVVTGGGSGFSSNFNFTAYVDNDNVTSGGGMLIVFEIAADIKAGDYPVYVDFHLEYKKDYEQGVIESDIVVPKELDKVIYYGPGHNYNKNEYTLTDAYFTDEETGQNILEDDNYRYNEETGFYHLYSLKDYPDTDGFGPILYAHITTKNVFRPNASLHTIEQAGNKALSVYFEGRFQNYKLFIEGIGPLLQDPTNGGTNLEATVGPYFCSPLCPCRVKGLEQGGCSGACAIGCTSCLPTCRQCPEEGLGSPGYAGVVNNDGLVPVTMELQIFLQRFAISQAYFIDGGGWAESQMDPPVHAGEDDQWLFACCYYKPND